MHIAAIDPAELDRIRAAGADDQGNAFTAVLATPDDTAPLRCCLRYARPGERIAAIAWSPFARDAHGPYVEFGPVFVHAERCAGYTDTGRYPEAYRDRRQIFRAYDATPRIVDAVMAEAGPGADATLAALLERPEVAFVHSRNVLYGCFMFEARRSPALRSG